MKSLEVIFILFFVNPTSPYGKKFCKHHKGVQLRSFFPKLPKSLFMNFRKSIKTICTPPCGCRERENGMNWQSRILLIWFGNSGVKNIDTYRYFQNIDPLFDIFTISICIENFLRKLGNTLYKLLDILKKIFVTLLRQFLETLVKNYPKNVKLF